MSQDLFPPSSLESQPPALESARARLAKLQAQREEVLAQGERGNEHKLWWIEQQIIGAIQRVAALERQALAR